MFTKPITERISERRISNAEIIKSEAINRASETIEMLENLMDCAEPGIYFNDTIIRDNRMSSVLFAMQEAINIIIRYKEMVENERE